MDNSFDWDKIPTDLQVDIICRLPEKYLVQFKSVSKSCYSLITYICIPKLSPPALSAPLTGVMFKHEQWKLDAGSGTIVSLKKFLDYRQWREHMGYMGCCFYDRDFVKLLSNILPFEYNHNDIEDCCNGILLVSNGSKVPKDYYVCNPATRQCIGIPSNPHQPEHLYASLAFDPSLSLDYMVVCFETHPLSAPLVSDYLKLDVFYSRINKWASHTVQIDQKIDLSERFTRSIYVNGILYTLCLPNYLVCFDLKEDFAKARAVKLPERGIRPCDPHSFSNPPGSPVTSSQLSLLGSIGVSKGCLCYSNHLESEMLVWLFQENGDKKNPWILKHRTDVDKLLWPMIQNKYRGRFPYLRCSDKRLRAFLPCALHPRLDIFFLGNHKLILAFKSGINKLEVVAQYEKDFDIMEFQSQIFPYSRCLVVLNDWGTKHQ